MKEYNIGDPDHPQGTPAQIQAKIDDWLNLKQRNIQEFHDNGKSSAEIDDLAESYDDLIDIVRRGL